MKVKKVMAGIVSAAMLSSMICGTAFAAEYADGSYVGEIHFLNANGTGSPSMCDPIFVHEAELVLDADTAELTFYVAYPIPAFPALGTDGTILDVVLTVDGTEYEVTSDTTTKPMKVFDTTSSLFGTTAGEEYPTQVLTADLPRDAVDNLEAGTVSVSAYVNAVMNSTQNFFMQMTGLKAAGESEVPVSETKDMQITAAVEESVSSPSYTVTVPESLSLGTLSTEIDNVFDYAIDVQASDLNGSLEVTAPESGNLTSGENTLEFMNNFGTKTITEGTASSELSGQISIAKENVKAAQAGNYTGTTTFSVTYTAK